MCRWKPACTVTRAARRRSRSPGPGTAPGRRQQEPEGGGDAGARQTTRSIPSLAGYQTAIFVGNEEERRIAEASKEALELSQVLDAPVVTPVEAAKEFYPAEGYHQDYYTKNPVRYRFYRFSCGRDSRVQQLWGDQAHDGIQQH